MVMASALNASDMTVVDVCTATAGKGLLVAAKNGERGSVWERI